MDIKELKVAGKRNHPWEYARSTAVKEFIAKYLHTENTGKLAVDIGCGDTFFLSKFHEKYPSYGLIAIDTAFDDEIIDNLSKKCAFPVLFLKDIEEMGEITEKASVIFLLDVIEHIEKDVDFLKELVNKPFVNEDTLFVITVPAFNALYCEHDRWLGHKRRYSLKMLSRHVQEAGLRKLAGGYFFYSLLLIRMIQKLFELIFGAKKETGIGNWNKGKFISLIYEKALLFDFRTGKLLHIPGLSTYMICKK